MPTQQAPQDTQDQQDYFEAHRAPSGAWLFANGFDKETGVAVNLLRSRRTGLRNYGSRNFDIVQQEADITLRQALARDVIDIRRVCSKDAGRSHVNAAMRALIGLSRKQYGAAMVKKAGIREAINIVGPAGEGFDVMSYESFTGMIKEILTYDERSCFVTDWQHLLIAGIARLSTPVKVAYFLRDLGGRAGLSRRAHPLYAQCWLSLISDSDSRAELALQLTHVGSGSYVFRYLNSLCGLAKQERAVRAFLDGINRSYRIIPIDVPEPRVILESMLNFEQGFSALIDALYAFDYSQSNDFAIIDRIMERITLLLPRCAFRPLIDDLDNRIWLNSESSLYADLWLNFAGSEEHREVFIQQLRGLNPDSFVFDFLSRLVEQAEDDNEIAIRNILLELGRLRVSDNEVLPLKRVGLRKLRDLDDHFYENFVLMMTGFLYYTYIGESGIVSDISFEVNDLAVEDEVDVLLSDLTLRRLSPTLAKDLLDYNLLWNDLLERKGGSDLLLSGLINLSSEQRRSASAYLRAASACGYMHADLAAILDIIDVLSK